MDERRIEDKLDKIVDHISNIDTTLAKQSVILDEHIKRTELLEKKLEPVERHVTIVNALVKVTAVLGSAIGTILGIVHAVMKLK